MPRFKKSARKSAKKSATKTAPFSQQAAPKTPLFTKSGTKNNKKDKIFKIKIKDATL